MVLGVGLLRLGFGFLRELQIERSPTGFALFLAVIGSQIEHH
jgi:hypothetical protein